MFVYDYCGNNLDMGDIYGDEFGAEADLSCSCGAEYVAIYALQGVEPKTAPEGEED